MNKIIVYPFPYGSKNNKYVSLLYSSLSRIEGDLSLEIINCENKFYKLLKFSNKSKNFSKNVIHIHWVNAIYGSKFLIKSIFLMILNFSILTYLKRFKGFKIIWTKHNYFSHDFSYPLIDIIGRKIMFKLADRVIIQQKSEYEKIKQGGKFLFIPHGNYIGAYGPLGERNKIRDKFGIKSDEVLLISIGVVKPYKKIENVIRAFKKSNNSKLKLLISGQCSEKYAQFLREEAQGLGQIIFNFNFIEDQNVPNYFAAADFSVFWYDNSVLTSGAIILSLSYGVPVIARNIPAADLISKGKNGFLFNNEQELIEVISNLPDIPEFDRNKIVASVNDLNWDRVVSDFLRIFDSLWKN